MGGVGVVQMWWVWCRCGGCTLSQNHPLVGGEAGGDRVDCEILSALTQVLLFCCPLTSEPPEISSVIGCSFLGVLNVGHLFSSVGVGQNKCYHDITEHDDNTNM